jgi:GNAT superfamily N-acetyltransferase
MSPAEAVAHVGELRETYAAVFSLPPYSEGPEMAEKFVGWIHDESKLPGFNLIAAYHGDRLVGFAYGYTMPSGEWWHNADRPAPEQVKAAEKFAVMEWAVLPDQCGKGIGRRLLDALLAGRHEPYAALTVNPQAEARILYERWGWQHVASTRPGKMPGMDVMVRKLAPTRRYLADAVSGSSGDSGTDGTGLVQVELDG